MNGLEKETDDKIVNVRISVARALIEIYESSMRIFFMDSLTCFQNTILTMSNYFA